MDIEMEVYMFFYFFFNIFMHGKEEGVFELIIFVSLDIIYS